MTEETQGQGFGQEPDVSPSEAAAADANEAVHGSGPAPGDQPEAGAAGAGAGGTGAEDQLKALRDQLEEARRQHAERVGDLQRLQAEYANYRKRVERDRIAVREAAIANLLTELLPVLDDIGRARDHGELVGGFKSVAESLETVAAKMGLQQFGKEGEPFDPLVHEALMHSYSPEVTETTCVQILQPGYRIGERTIRPARVAVAEPQPGVPHTPAAEAAASGPAEGDGGGNGEGSAEEETGGPEQG